MLVKNCTLIKPLCCNEDDSVVKAAKILRKNKQRRLIVINKEKEPVGIISTTDLSNRVVAENRLPETLKAKDIMTAPIYLVCDIKDSLDMLYEKMLKHKSFFVPVTKNKKLFGIITYGEIIKRIGEIADGTR